MAYFVGIDISKASFDAVILDGDGKVLHQGKYTMDRQGFEDFVQILTSYGPDGHIVMESTGFYHLLLLHYLVERGFTCHLVNPLRIKHHIQSLSLRKSKTDTKDAHGIARFALAYAKALPPLTQEDFSSLKTLLREYESLSKEIAKVKGDIKGLVDRLFPELSKNTNIFTRSVLHLLLQAPSRKRVRNLKEKKIERILQEHSGNKATISAKAIRQWAKASVGINDKALEAILQSKIRRLFTLQQERKVLQEAIQEALDESNLHDDIDILTSIPGIGKSSATAFLAHIGSITKFSSVKRLCAYIGFDPVIYQSGSSLFTKGHISKRGNASLRRTLWHMALGVIRNIPRFKAYYEKKRHEGKAFKQAVVAVANKLLRTIFTLLKNKSPFNPALI